MIKKTSLLLLSTLSFQLSAGYDATRMTTVVDDYSGSYTTTKNGRFDDSAYLGTSVTEFSNFHLRDEEESAGLSGTITKDVNRSNGYLETVSSGHLVFSGNENTLEISFEGLSALFDEELTLSGIVTVNEEDFEVADLPPAVAGILRKVFKITRR